MQRGDIFTEIVLETFKVSGLLTTEGDRLTEAHGLSSARWKILGSLARSNSPLTVSQIARIMGQARQSVQRLVDVMYKDEILNFINNPNHKRAKLIVLTTKGQGIYTDLNEIWNPWANQYSKELNEQELKITLATLKKITLLFKA
ncbi:MAG: MarR family transcriptional regulator [Zetaproteobacteria bacterium]|nr:MarR family transcriptional regulator [Zetaproteobacteria bacterium]